MEPIEIIILAVGAILVASTYILSEKFELSGKNIDDEISSSTKRIAEEMVRNEVDRELANVIDEKVEKVSVELDKIANEKILAVGNYSDDVLNKIDKNHEEVMFLYSMLSEKEAVLKDTVKDIEALKLSIRKMAEENEAVTSVQANVNLDKESEDKISVSKNTAEVTENDMMSMQEKYLYETQKNLSETDGISDVGGGDITEKRNNKNDEILKLNSEGYTNMEIAKKLGIGTGEVTLVIDLFKRQRA